MAATRMGVRCLSRYFHRNAWSPGSCGVRVTCSSLDLRSRASLRPISTTSFKSDQEPMGNQTCFDVTDEDNFNENVLKSSKPVVVDFHAEWCGPCKLLGPKLEKAVSAYGGKILLAKVDIDEISDIAMQYEVKVVPTVVGIKNGQKAQEFEGNIPESELKSFLDKLLLK